jgi:glycosyltransferase involved in cell wall biosynthesis
MPLVSVLIPAFYSTPTLSECLLGLRRQTFRDFEVILVNSSPEEATAALVRNSFPEVYFEQSPVRLMPHAARNRAVDLATGEILVFSDPDCRMHEQALEWLVAAHKAGHAVVGGALENAGAGWWTSAVHLTKFAWWLPGGEAAPRPDLPTALTAFSRSAWNRIGPFDAECWCGDSMIIERFLHGGGVPWLEPRAFARHHHLGTAGAFLQERFSRGRDYGANRPRHRGWNRMRVAAQLALFPLLPVLMTLRSLRYAASSRRLGEALFSLPVIFAGNAAWCAGEAVSHFQLV